LSQKGPEDLWKSQNLVRSELYSSGYEGYEESIGEMLRNDKLAIDPDENG
jgi:hypothetical protein